MKKIIPHAAYVLMIVLIIFLSKTDAEIKNEGSNMSNNIKQITVKDIDGKSVNLADYKDKVLLIVNVASYCGYTKQYAGLEKIYKDYKDKGFEILAFPCNQFGEQEPGTNEEIKNFCSSKFDVSFKLFDKVDVNGKNQSPLYSILTNNEVTGKSEIKWNFEKFLIDKEGNVVARYPSKVEPTSEELISAIDRELTK
ncbi:MAG: glutathione peroxidase [Ignavibacterium sp.]|jgi:glutathione peroxidase|nr:glutathione peroxidase [Ignavibacterium sp.]